MDLIEPLIAAWSRILPGQAITRQSHFFASGGDSLAATAMCLEIEQKTGCAVPVGQIYLTPVLENFAAVLQSFDADNRSPLFIPLNPTGTGRPVFGIAPAMGGVFHFRQLAAAFSDDRPFHVIEPRISAAGTHTYSSIRDLATCALDVVQSKQPQGPYTLAGFSFGGPLAWEMARLLEETGERVDCLILLDSSIRNGYAAPANNPGIAARIALKWQFYRDCRRVRTRFGEAFRYGRWLPLVWQKLKDSLPGTARELKEARTGTIPPRPGEADMKVESQERLRDGYNPGTYKGTVHLFRAEHQLTLHRELDLDLGWSSHLPEGRLVIRTVPGDHFSLLKSPHVNVLAREVQTLAQESDKAWQAEIDTEFARSSRMRPLPFEEPVNDEDLMGRLVQVVRTFPDQIAIRDGGKRLTYAEFYAIAERIAEFLLEQQPDAAGPVLLHFETSWQFICASHAVLLAGRCYVPVDTDFPDLRIKEIATLAGAGCAFTLDTGGLARAIGDAMPVFSFGEASRFNQPHRHSLPVPTDPGKPAVLLFTSGSTGSPKGTVLHRRMLLHLCWRRTTAGGFCPADRYALFYISAFMGGVMAIHAPLCAGATLCLFDIRRRGLAEIPTWMKEERITVVHMITSIMRRLLTLWNGSPPLPDLRLLIPGGERARGSDIELWKRTCQSTVGFATCLGSTECGTIAMYPLSFDFGYSAGPLPVGRPFASLNARVVREDGSVADTFEEGQLVIESHYIFRGYLNADELNKSVLSFSEDGKAVYKTGDYGFFDDVGIFYNAGRHDSRVKVNGNLVELAEVESVLIRSGLIDEVAVIHRALESSSEAPALVAFYRAKNAENLESRLAAFLLDHLPRAMLPGKWVQLSAFPQTTNGKTDRRALAILEFQP